MASSGNAPDFDEDEPRQYQIEYSEAAQEEIEKAYLWRSSITSPEVAALWTNGLRSAVDSLSTMPYRYAALPDDPLSRRLLYGNGQGAYCIIYRVGNLPKKATTLWSVYSMSITGRVRQTKLLPVNRKKGRDRDQLHGSGS